MLVRWLVRWWAAFDRAMLTWWFGLGMKWTERQCRRHGGDHYSNGYPWLLRKFGWD